MTLSREAAEGELAKDEFLRRFSYREAATRTECTQMRVVGNRLQIKAAHGLDWSHRNLFGLEEVRGYASCDPDPNGWPRALAYFEEHCRREAFNELAKQVEWTLPAPEAGRVLLAGSPDPDWDPDAVEPPDSPEPWLSPAAPDGTAAPSPADGPAKVFENETEAFGHLIAGPRDWRGKQAYDWLKLRGVDVEGVMLKALPRILERLPAEQVVQAMGEETRRAIGSALQLDRISDLEDECAKAIRGRQEALARAEKAEAKLGCTVDFGCSYCGDVVYSFVFGDMAKTLRSEHVFAIREHARACKSPHHPERRAEQAERERDEARREIERLRTGAVAGVSANVTVGTPPRDVPSHAFRHQTSRGTDAWFWFGHISYTEDGHTFISWPASSSDDLPAMYRSALRETHAPLPPQTSKAVTYNG
ncbi:MAG TPA: hypothetical protein VGK73_08960 [Polyangiaceae bacterium]